MFSYFKNNYPLDLALNWMLDLGAQIGELDTVLGEYRDEPFASDEQASDAWCGGLIELGRRLERQMDDAIREDHQRSAAARALRGALYYLNAERGLAPSDSKKLEVYTRGLDLFRQGVSRRGDNIEFLEINYGEGQMPALFHRPEGNGPFPCVVQFQGLDSIKEFLYLGLARDMSARGIATLFVDQPGTGGALRLHNLKAQAETEIAAGKCVDYLETRNDVIADRIGIMGISLGGFYAPRAAAFEQRLACCVSWGAMYSIAEVGAMREKQGDAYAGSVPHFDEHAEWVFREGTDVETLEKIGKITLDGVLDKITCPYLIVHGENDRQIPPDHAQKSYEGAINSKSRRLVLLTDKDGGVEHCSIDNPRFASEIMCDWIADTLKP